MKRKLSAAIFFFLIIVANSIFIHAQNLKINKDGYFDKHGLNVVVLNDVYPEGHQGGITIIQHGTRVISNGNLTLCPAPGQWQPHPRLLDKKILEDEGK